MRYDFVRSFVCENFIQRAILKTSKTKRKSDDDDVIIMCRYWSFIMLAEIKFDMNFLIWTTPRGIFIKF